MLRVATKHDAAAILDIYAPFILNSGITQETEVPSVDDFQKRIASTLIERPWIVCEINGEIAGYAYGGKHRDRKGYHWCVESSLYISEKYFGSGVAHALYAALFDLLKLQGYVNAYAVITLPNNRSVAFHEKFGFYYFTTYKKVGYKLGRWHDVGWWQYDVNPHGNDPRDPVEFSKIDRSAIDEILLRHSSKLEK